MTQDQVLGLVRNLIAFAGGYFVSRGWLNSEQIILLTAMAATVVPFIWTLFAHTTQNQVATVVAMSAPVLRANNIKGIITEATTAGRELAASTPAETVVSAGTVEAKALGSAVPTPLPV